MKGSRHAPIVLVGAASMIVALVSIGWWLTSPENARKAGQAIVMLAGAICAVQHSRRLPKASPLVLCGAIIGLGFPFLVARLGPMFTTALVASVVIAWTGVGISRVVRHQG